MARIAVRAWPDAAGQGTLSPVALGAGYSRPPASRRRASLRIPLPLSALLHLLLVLALLFLPQRQPETPDIGEAGTVDVVMVPAGVPEAPAELPPEPNPATPEPPMPALPLPPPAPPSPPVAAAPAPPPAPPENPPAPPAPEALAAPPAPLPVPQTRPSAPPEPEEAAAPPAPPPRPPTPPRPAAVRPTPFPRPVARSFADLGTGLRTESRPEPEPAPPLPRGAMNLAIGPEARASKGSIPLNPDSTRGILRIEGADLGEDWARALLAWWNEHSFYPHQAAENDEDGTNRLRVLVDRTGRVHSVELEMRSGSQWLDMGSLAIFRDARLPPFPLATPQNEATLHLTIQYILIHRGGG